MIKKEEEDKEVEESTKDNKGKIKLIEKNKKIELLEATATLFFPEDSQLNLKDEYFRSFIYKREVSILGINLQCFDNPKLNNDSNIKNF